MKGIKKLLVLVLSLLLVLPIMVGAEGENASKSKVKVYFFKGDGCSFCAAAETWFASIQGEYGEKFEIVDYEVWYNEENSVLMDEVAAYFGETPEGVPYIVIGEEVFGGFNEESYGQAMKDAIDYEYELDESERFDVMTKLGTPREVDKGSILGSIIAVTAIVLVIGVVVFVRSKSETENSFEEKKSVKKEEPVVKEEIEEAPKKVAVPKKTTTTVKSKKTTTTKKKK